MMVRSTMQVTQAQAAEVETLAAVLTSAQIADFLGIGRTTFYAILDRDRDLAERYKRGRARAVGAVAQSLITKARAGNVTAMIFYLKTQGGWRETWRWHRDGRNPARRLICPNSATRCWKASWKSLPRLRRRSGGPSNLPKTGARSICRSRKRAEQADDRVSAG